MNPTCNAIIAAQKIMFETVMTDTREGGGTGFDLLFDIEEDDLIDFHSNLLLRIQRSKTAQAVAILDNAIREFVFCAMNLTIIRDAVAEYNIRDGKIEVVQKIAGAHR